MRPAARLSPMYLFIASRSGAEREKRQPLGGLVPARRSIAQSYARWGGSDVVRLLLKTSPSSRYCENTEDRSGEVLADEKGGDHVHAAVCRQVEWHLGLHPVMSPWLQSTWGLCFRIHGRPRTSGTCGELITRRTISSWWFPEIRTLIGTVACRTSSSWTPVIVQGCIGLANGTVGMPRRQTRVGQMKLVSDPESRRTGTWSWVPPLETCAETPGFDAVGEEESVTPVRIPSLTDGCGLLLDTWRGRVQLPHSTGKDGSPGGAVTRTRRAWPYPPAWAPCQVLQWRGLVLCCGYRIFHETGPGDDGRYVGRPTGRPRAG